MDLSQLKHARERRVYEFADVNHTEAAALDVSLRREPEARERVRRGGNLGTSGPLRTTRL